MSIHMPKLVAKRARLNSGPVIRDISSLGLSAQQADAARAECRRVSAARDEWLVPCVDLNGHCCKRCESIGRALEGART